MVCRRSIALLSLCGAAAVLNASAFTYTQEPSTVTRKMSQVLHMSDFFADATPQKVVEENVVHEDSNGKVISPGTFIAISSPNIRAHSVHRSLYGSFNTDTKEFIPQDEETSTRKTSCLILPVGLRGEVLKTFDTNEWDRTHPILVKFTAGGGGESGYNLAKQFNLHVDADEIKVK